MTGQELYERYRALLPSHFAARLWKYLHGCEQKAWDEVATQMNAQIKRAFKLGEENGGHDFRTAESRAGET